MLPLSQKYAFLMFTLVTMAWGAHGFFRLYLRIRRGRPQTATREPDHIAAAIVDRDSHHSRPVTDLQRIGPSSAPSTCLFFMGSSSTFW